MDDLPRMLLLASTQFTGIVNDTQLSKSVRFSTSAGLPHFANSYMREWGRDTFISAPGLFVTTERFDELESIIVSYLQVTRHYLVPNLLDGGTKPRYNCRDAIWFLFYTTICYDKYSPRCIDFLQTYVEADPLKGKNSTEKRKFKIIDLLIKLLLIYEEGIDFIEENAGPEIDEHMTEEGFHITLKKDENSFIVGGNKHNCLTWMDKMGSSVEAKNKGVPSTSRNGAPIELTALCLYSLRWVLSLNERGIVNLSSSVYEYLHCWKRDLEKNISVMYTTRKRTIFSNEEEEIYINDLIGCADFSQNDLLRPNALIALTLIPDVFDEDTIISHILLTKKELLGDPKQIGIKTLAPFHSLYVPYYDNYNNSTDASTAHGASYHNGPEWLWISSFWCSAICAQKKNRKIQQLFPNLNMLIGHLFSNQEKTIKQGPWYSLPELTNANGEYNVHSCQAQAWSISCLLWFFFETLEYKREQDISSKIFIKTQQNY